MTQPAPRPPTAGDGSGTWDLAFIRVGAWWTLGATALALPVLALTAGWRGVWAVVLGAAVVTAFFAASGHVVAWAGRTFGDASTLPAALLVFGVKLLVLLALLLNLPAVPWIDPVLVGWSVFVGVLLWTGIQMRWVWTRQLYYVPPPEPPAAQP